MGKKLLFFLLATFLLLPWPVAYAYDQDLGETSAVDVSTAAPGTEPAWEAFGRAIGGLSRPGDLFFIDALRSPEVVPATLHITNAYDLARTYRYLILKVGIYIQDASGQWRPATDVGGELFPDSYLTLRNGQVSFDLPGHARYKVTIDRGSFSCFAADRGYGDISPQFYLTVD